MLILSIFTAVLSILQKQRPYKSLELKLNDLFDLTDAVVFSWEYEAAKKHLLEKGYSARSKIF